MKSRDDFCPTCSQPVLVQSDDDGTSHYVPRTYEGAWGTKEMVEYARHFRDEVLPKIDESAIAAQLMPPKGHGDVKFWCELGASVALGKPILTIARSHEDVPAKLLEISDEVVIVEDIDDPDAQMRVAAAVERMRGAQ